jgi:hypothetical protein
MAQGSKSRIIIWTIVGILAVVAVVFVITNKKSDSGKPPVNADRFVKQMEVRFEKFEQRVSEAQAANPGAPAEQWQKIGEQVALGRQVMANMSGLTDQKDLQPRRDSVQKAYLAAAKLLKVITGKDEGKAGGE